MDYIYKNNAGEKCIGTVEGLVITPVFDFSIAIKGKTIWCQLEHAFIEWKIHFISINESAELSHPKDIEWNTNAIFEIFKDVDASLKVANAIRYVYMKAYNEIE